MHVIGIIGRLNTGKDAIANVCKRHGYVRRAFADPIKEIVHQLFNVPRDVLWGDSQGRTADVRQMLQHLGTDYARNIDPDVWIRQMRKQIERCKILQHRGVVIPDVRFINEAKMLREIHATLIRIIRPQETSPDKQTTTQHISEKENLLIPESWIYHTITNDGTLQDLEHEVNTILRGDR